MKKPVFEGLATAIVTPFKNGTIDIPTFEKLLDTQLAANVDAVVVLGPDELAAGQCTVRDMASHEERKVALADVAQELADALGLTEGHGDGCGCGCGCHDGECDCDGDCDCGDECTCGNHQH